MKKYVYLIITSEGNILAVYDDEKIAKKLKTPIEEKFKTKVEILKKELNVDIAFLK